VRAAAGYNGIILHETSAISGIRDRLSCAVAARYGPALSPMKRIPDSQTASRRCRCACSATATMRGSGRMVVATAGNRLGQLSWSRRRPLSQLAKKYVPKGSAPVFTFGLKSGYDAGVKLFQTCDCFRTSPISRHPLADHSSASTTHPAHRRAGRYWLARGLMWSGSRSASKMWRIYRRSRTGADGRNNCGGSTTTMPSHSQRDSLMQSARLTGDLR